MFINIIIVIIIIIINIIISSITIIIIIIIMFMNICLCLFVDTNDLNVMENILEYSEQIFLNRCIYLHYFDHTCQNRICIWSCVSEKYEVLHCFHT